jgi:hypothetical protein
MRRVIGEAGSRRFAGGTLRLAQCRSVDSHGIDRKVRCSAVPRNTAAAAADVRKHMDAVSCAERSFEITEHSSPSPATGDWSDKSPLLSHEVLQGRPLVVALVRSSDLDQGPLHATILSVDYFLLLLLAARADSDVASLTESSCMDLL